MTDTRMTPDQSRAWVAFFDLSRELFTVLERTLLDVASVSVADLEILRPLLEENPRGLRARDLGDRAGWQTSRVSHQLRRMESRGLVERRRDPADGRGTVVRLTDAGLQRAAAAVPVQEETVRALVFDHLSAEEVRVLESVSRTVLGVLGQRATSGPRVDFPRT